MFIDLRALSSADHVVRGIAALYGLRLLVPKEGQYTITIASPRTTKGFEDIGPEVRRLLPLAFETSLDAQTIRISDKGQQASSLDTAPSGQDKHATQRLTNSMAKFKARNTAANSYYFAALRRLLVLIGPSLPNSSSEAIPANRLDPETLRLTAIAMLAGNGMIGLDQICNLTAPSFILQPRTMWIQTAKQGESVITGFGNGERDIHGRLGLKFIRAVPLTAPGSTRAVQSPH